MQPKMKIVVAVLVVALIAVIGLIVVTDRSGAEQPARQRPRSVTCGSRKETAALEQGRSHRRIGAGR